MSRSSRGHNLYRVILVLTIAALAALPLVHVSVSVPGSGIVRPILEKQPIRARASGFIRDVRVADDQPIRANDTLLILEDTDDRTQDRRVRDQLAERRELMADLTALVDGIRGSLESTTVRAPVARAELARFRAERRRQQVTIDESRRQLELTKAMGHDGGLVSVDELRRRESDLAQQESDRQLQTDRTIADWTARLRSERDNVRDLEGRLAELARQRRLLVLLAPVDGTAEQVASMSPGGFVQAGDEVLQISPSTDLTAEMRVSTRDIGLLSVGMPVRLMIDAFDYNSWGVATGKVVSISHDAMFSDNQAIYIVRSTIDRPTLKLKNGYEGRIQKGMTLTARFVVARRSLLQLMYDRVDSWLNPARGQAGD